MFSYIIDEDKKDVTLRLPDHVDYLIIKNCKVDNLTLIGKLVNNISIKCSEGCVKINDLDINNITIKESNIEIKGISKANGLIVKNSIVKIDSIIDHFITYDYKEIKLLSDKIRSMYISSGTHHCNTNSNYHCNYDSNYDSSYDSSHHCNYDCISDVYIDYIKGGETVQIKGKGIDVDLGIFTTKMMFKIDSLDDLSNNNIFNLHNLFSEGAKIFINSMKATEDMFAPYLKYMKVKSARSS